MIEDSGAKVSSEDASQTRKRSVRFQNYTRFDPFCLFNVIGILGRWLWWNRCFGGFVVGFGEIFLLDCIGFVIISKLSESLFVRWFYNFLFLNPGFGMTSVILISFMRFIFWLRQTNNFWKYELSFSFNSA